MHTQFPQNRQLSFITYFLRKLGWSGLRGIAVSSVLQWTIIRITELSFPRTFAPKNESTIGGTFAPGSESYVELSFPGTFAPCNNMYRSLELLPPCQYKKHISVTASTKEDPNALSALVLWEKECLQRMIKASRPSVVASACHATIKAKSSIMSDRVLKMPEGHMSSDGTTTRRADYQQRSVGDVSVPYRKPEHSRQLDTVTRYRWGSDESRWWLCTWRAQAQPMAQARQANGDCHSLILFHRTQVT